MRIEAGLGAAAVGEIASDCMATAGGSGLHAQVRRRDFFFLPTQSKMPRRSYADHA
jgi:hypothetical protein